MSYDLMVFEPPSAPRDREGFLAWYQTQTEWPELHGYNDPGVTSPRLRKWYEDITRAFPNLNGPGVGDESLDDLPFTDYSIGTQLIYAAFRWSDAEEAYSAVRRLAVEHAVGFYDVSGDEGDGEIYFPGNSLRPESQGGWRQIASEFRALRDREEE